METEQRTLPNKKMEYVKKAIALVFTLKHFWLNALFTEDHILRIAYQELNATYNEIMFTIF